MMVGYSVMLTEFKHAQVWCGMDMSSPMYHRYSIEHV